ncbi:hypothetical protein LOZ53_000403 [Ophidiomyces ophidiicola]|uniref:Uncharacterized protein n=1 Tax=Ophidiomyces ophidiicola TaxID=1387563 RepID=A0ACB8V2V8_9EURO|nr:uncharacterized protein LOZ57_006694 [Ophidiomyces ophidiicola]KAI1918182.1 hypothetical protein LOZ64_002923 [Ophidiomyces ophidiicola]KAI1937027.1 hypothetical protein LOZ57_006694 [Ophidiomyces ophidiicola]KAI1954668.1 hypothetical protein LOZ62_000683 [Ophidiomyces ophidiicola]KAI1958520.1 hypothetical protein LOZ59_003452 [Ophidiomyces ophidiicola]KAI1979135.1 hypothetical protein LOZ55_002191 [Ophidiomyces ophidiicola]
MLSKLILGCLALPSFFAFAKTNLQGCTSTTSVDSFSRAVNVWYVPGTGEVCELLDCGGGRAPPKYSVPGCAAYTGTETYSPRFLALPTPSSASSTPKPVSTASEAASVPTDVTPSSSVPASSTAVSAPSSTSSPAVTSMATGPTEAASGTASVTSVSGRITTSSLAIANATSIVVVSKSGSATGSMPAVQTLNAASSRMVGNGVVAGTVVLVGLLAMF